VLGEDLPDLCMASVAGLTAAFRSGALSPVDAARAALARSEAINPDLNAFTLLDHEGAQTAAEASARRWREGTALSPIDGVPTTVKDIVRCGLDIRYGSRATDDVSDQGDAPAVKRLRAAGAVIIGVTTSPEFGWKAVTDSPAFGITRNPWNPDMTPGGSSGGAAVAAACGAGVLHIGTDGGGSIRIPAAFTGTVGHKPTYGTVPAWPASAFGTVAHLGPMARSVADTAAMLNVMAGCDNQDWAQGWRAHGPVAPSPTDFRGVRIGYWKTAPGATTDPEITAHIEACLADLDAAGAIIEPVDLPMQDAVPEIFDRFWLVGAATRLAAIAPDRHADMDPGFIAAADAGARYTAVERAQAENDRAEYGAAMDMLLDRLDLLMSPSVAIAPFTVGRSVPEGTDWTRWTEWAGFSYPLNLSQQPACSVPCGTTSNGLPIGLQIIGARGADQSVLSAALEIEAMYPNQFLLSGRSLPDALRRYQK